MAKTLQPSLQIRAKAKRTLEKRKEARRDSEFSDFIRQVNPTLLDYEHIPRLINVFQRVSDTFQDDWSWEPDEPNYKRVMVLMPPRYFKSETGSRLFAAYQAYRYPEQWSGITSYGAELAWELNGDARGYYQQMTGLQGESQSVKRWETDEEGGVWADGVGGSLIGRGYHTGIIDDPIKPRNARSEKHQKNFKHWYPGTFLSRAEPGAAIVLIMQRLAGWDPVEFLWEREIEEDAQHWHIVCFDEIKSDEPLGSYDGPKGIPKTCTLEEDPREVGEVLAASRFDEEEVDRKQGEAGMVAAQAQRQQRPTSPQGDFWKRGSFSTYTTLPEHAYDGGKDWDTAYTKDESNSASAYVESYRGPEDEHGRIPIYIHDCDWQWLEFPELTAWMQQLDGPHHVEQKASGKSVTQSLERENIPVQEVPVEGGDKLARASSVQPVVDRGQVYVHEGVISKLLEGDRQGLLNVTVEKLINGGPNLDLNDAFVQAINRHQTGDLYTIV